LGNRSSLEWLIVQYRVKTDRQWDIVNEPCHNVFHSTSCNWLARGSGAALPTVGKQLPHRSVQWPGSRHAWFRKSS